MKNTFLMLQPYICNNDLWYQDKDYKTPIQYKIYSVQKKDTLRYIPNGCEDMVLLFNIEETRSHIIFPAREYIDIIAPGYEVLGIRLQPGYTFADEIELDDIADVLRSLETFEARKRYISNNIRRMIVNKCSNRTTTEVLREISQSKGIRPVTEIYDMQKYSVRHVNRVFVEEMGIGVKDYARYTRFQNAVNMMLRDPESPALKYLECLNYSDQAHYQREFRQFMGMTPKKFIQKFLVHN